MKDTVSRIRNDGRATISMLENAIGKKGSGLSRSEKAFVSLAVRVKCGAPVHDSRQQIERLTRDPRGVALLIEEGFPSPLTGRAGAIATAAADLSGRTAQLNYPTAMRLQSEALDDDQRLDFILLVALEHMRLRLPSSPL